MIFFPELYFVLYVFLYFGLLILIDNYIIIRLSKSRFPSFIYFQRLLYVVIFSAGFIFLKLYSERFDSLLYDLSYPNDIILTFIRFIFAFLLIVIIAKDDFFYFIGVKQVLSLIAKKRLSINSKANKRRFLTTLKYVFFLLILLLSPYKNVADLFLDICYFVYFSFLFFVKSSHN